MPKPMGGSSLNNPEIDKAGLHQVNPDSGIDGPAAIGPAQRAWLGGSPYLQKVSLVNPVASVVEELLRKYNEDDSSILEREAHKKHYKNACSTPDGTLAGLYNVYPGIILELYDRIMVRIFSRFQVPAKDGDETRPQVIYEMEILMVVRTMHAKLLLWEYDGQTRRDLLTMNIRDPVHRERFARQTFDWISDQLRLLMDIIDQSWAEGPRESFMKRLSYLRERLQLSRGLALEAMAETAAKLPPPAEASSSKKAGPS